MKIGRTKIWMSPSGTLKVRIVGDPIGPGGNTYPIDHPSGAMSWMKPDYDGPYYPIEILDGRWTGKRFIVDGRELQ